MKVSDLKIGYLVVILIVTTIVSMGSLYYFLKQQTQKENERILRASEDRANSRK